MQPITMKWRGAEYTIPANRAFEIGEKVERIVTIGEIGSWGQRVPFYTVARCFTEMLKSAGVAVTKEEVFSDIMAGLSHASEADTLAIDAVGAVHALVACLMGGAPAAAPVEGGSAKTSAS